MDMLKFTSTRRLNGSFLLLLLAMFAGMTGCSKQFSEWSLNSARENVQAARDNEADVYQPQLLESVASQVQQTEQLFNSGNYGQAKVQAKQAKEASRDLLNQTLQARAQKLVAQANDSVAVANRNNAMMRDPELGHSAEESNAKAGEYLAKGKFKNAIDAARLVEANVTTLLQPMRDQAQKQKQDLLALFEVLNRHGAEEMPTEVAEARAQAQRMVELVDVQRSYSEADTFYRDAEASMKIKVVTAMEMQANSTIKRLEQMLTTAVQEDAREYNPEQLQACLQDHESILAAFFKNDYQQVLASAELLEPRIDSLISDNRQRAAESLRDRVRELVRSLEAENVREHLPGRLEQVDTFLEAANEEYNQGDFKSCRKSCEAALQLQEFITRDFSELASREVQAASSTVVEATYIVERMDEIFQMQQRGASEPTAFRASRRTDWARLVAIAEDAEKSVSAATEQRDAEQFNNAISNSRQAEDKANYVVRETFHIVAHYNVLELTERVSEIQSNGAQRFAPDELTNVKKTLEAARQIIAEGETREKEAAEGEADPETYRPAVMKTAEAKAELAGVIQLVVESAAERVNEAREALDNAQANRADQYAGQDIEDARRLLASASENLRNLQALRAANEADQAAEVALGANVQSLKTQARQALLSARSELDEAEVAEAQRFAAEEYKEALENLAGAEDFFAAAEGALDQKRAADSYRSALLYAEEARKDARSARLKPLMGANVRIAEARRRGAWAQDYELLMMAIVNAKIAAEAMQRGDYNLMRDYADRAEKQAARAEREAKNAAYNERLNEVKNSLTEAAYEDGGAYFSVDDIRALAGELRQVMNTYEPKEFDRVMLALDQVESKALEIGKQTPGAFTAVYDSQRKLYDTLGERGAKNFAEDDMREADMHLRQASLEYDRGVYRGAYYSLLRAVRVLGQIDLNWQERQFVASIRDLVKDLDEDTNYIRSILSVDASTLRRLAERQRPDGQITAVIGDAKPDRFRRAMDDMYLRSQSMEYPITMKAQRDAMVEMVDLMRQSSFQFERLLILQHYDAETRGEIIYSGYDLVSKAQNLQDRLMKQFETKGLQGPPGSLQYVIGG